MLLNEGFGRRAKLVLSLEAGAPKSLAGEQAEPDFDLIEPTGRGGSKVKLHSAFVLGQPVVLVTAGIAAPTSRAPCWFSLPCKHARIIRARSTSSVRLLLRTTSWFNTSSEHSSLGACLSMPNCYIL